MNEETKNKSEGASEQTRRAFMRTNLGRVVGGALGLSLASRAFGKACHADQPHSDTPAYSDDSAHADAIMGDNHYDEVYHNDHPHYDTPHGDNPDAHSDATATHSDWVTHSNTGHADHVNRCVHSDTPSHGDTTHGDQLLHVDNCN
jgi:hypothetical protein